MAGEVKAGTTPFWAICSKCRHCWIAAYYPLELALFGRIAKGHSRCPKCNGAGLVAKQDGGILQEPDPHLPLGSWRSPAPATRRGRSHRAVRPGRVLTG